MNLFSISVSSDMYNVTFIKKTAVINENNQNIYSLFLRTAFLTYKLLKVDKMDEMTK